MDAQEFKNNMLHLAIQGKLLPQNPNDEPASVLLERIKEEKEQLIKDKKIKRNNKESIIFRKNNHFYEKIGKKGEEVCIDDELPFKIPDSWEWTRLDNIGVYKKGPFGSALTKSIFVPKSKDSIKVYEQKNAIQKNEKLGDYYITKEYYKNKMKGFTVESGDIIVSCAGTIGETYVLPNNIELGIINQALMRMNIVNSLNLDYFLMYFDYILKKSAIEHSKGSAIKNIPPFKIFKRLLIPIPPIEEQKRIMNLLNIVEDYVQYDNKLNNLNKKFAESFKNIILQEAIQGKLVEQNPNDEPASVLLKRIKEEKEQLIKDKKIKRNKNESFIYRENNHFYEKIGTTEPICIDDDLPFEIPENWEWVRFGSVVNFSLGKTPQRKNPDFWDNATVPWVSIADMNDGEIINHTKEKVNDYAINKTFKGKIVPKGTLLMSFKLTVGKVSILGINAVHNEAIISINPFIDENNSFRNYLFYILPLISQTGDTKSAIKGKTLNSKSLNNLLIPLPPFDEQNKIIEKISELFENLKN